ncbi:right-handed parallel beta-helix repeat-containing protein [Streptomyces pseudoechinosporeus]
MRTARAVWRRWVPTAMVVVTAGAVGVAGAVPATATAKDGTVVNCKDNPRALQPAITAAPPGATLRVKGTCTGPFTINKDLTLIGLERAVLDGNQAGSTVTVTNAVRVRLTTLTITNGAGRLGGGIHNAGGTVTLDHSTVKGNTAEDGGGGIYNLNGPVTLDHSTVEGNTATSSSLGSGGGIYNAAGTVTLNNRSTVKGNTAEGGGGGGGIVNTNGGTVTLDRSTVERNTAKSDGGGGGIVNNAGGTVTLNNRSTVKGNTAEGAGGGIFNGGEVTLDHSTVEGNTATSSDLGIGGGIFNAGTVTLNNRSTVERNTASRNGGGIFNDDFGTMTLNRSTVKRNTTSGNGGGIYNDGGTVTLNRSTVRDNTPDNCFPPGSVPGCTG